MSALTQYLLSTDDRRELFVIFLVDVGATCIFSYYRPYTGCREEMKIYEVLKRASVHLAVVIHYSTGTTTISASLVLKRVRIRCARSCCCKVFSGRRCISSAVLAHYSTGTTSSSLKGMQRRFCCKLFSGKQRRKNAVGFATEVVDSLLWVERHSGTVTGLPPQERLQKRIH